MREQVNKEKAAINERLKCYNKEEPDDDQKQNTGEILQVI